MSTLESVTAIDSLLSTVNSENKVVESPPDTDLTLLEMSRLKEMKSAIQTAFDITSEHKELIPDHLLSEIISFARCKLPLNIISKPTELSEAFGEINDRGELEGFCYLKYKDGSMYQGLLANGELHGTYEYLVQAWAKTIGFTHINLEDSNSGKSFALVLDDKFEINIGFQKNTNNILLVSYFRDFRVKELSNDTRHKLYEKLLKANFAFVESGMGALGICPNGEQVTFSMQSEDLEKVHVKKFHSLFDHMVKMSEKWEPMLQEIKKGNDEKANESK